MSYKDNLARALDLNKTNAVIFYGMTYRKGELIRFEEIMNA